MEGCARGSESAYCTMSEPALKCAMSRLLEYRRFQLAGRGATHCPSPLSSPHAAPWPRGQGHRDWQIIDSEVPPPSTSICLPYSMAHSMVFPLAGAQKGHFTAPRLRHRPPRHPLRAICPGSPIPHAALNDVWESALNDTWEPEPRSRKGSARPPAAQRRIWATRQASAPKLPWPRSRRTASHCTTHHATLPVTRLCIYRRSKQ